MRARPGFLVSWISAIFFVVLGQTPSFADAGSSCPNGTTNSNGTLLGTDTVPGNSNSDTARLALVQQLANNTNIVQVSCSFTPGNAQSGTWTASSPVVTHILVKASTVQQVYAVSSPPKGSGSWSTQCIVNNGGQQPNISGVFCYSSQPTGGNNGTITVEKETAGGTGSFNFKIHRGQTEQNSFALTTSQGANPVSSGAFSKSAGTTSDDYTVSESEPQNWNVVAINCTSNMRPSFSGDLPNEKVTIPDLKVGENVTCRFKNEFKGKTGKLTIKKKVSGGDGTFSFSGDLGQFALDVDDGETKAFGPVTTAEGDYAITEIVPAGWKLKSIQCTGDSHANVSLSQKKVTIDLDKDEDVVCTFTNEPEKGSFKLKKKTIGGKGKFEFTASGPSGFSDTFFEETFSDGGSSSGEWLSDLLPGTYTFDEDLPAGWKLTSVECETNKGVSGGVTNSEQGIGTVTVDSGAADGTCTFTNTFAHKGKIKIKKQTLGGVGEFSFDATGVDDFSLNTTGQPNNTKEIEFQNLQLGNSYTFKETEPAGWKLKEVKCETGSGTFNEQTKVLSIALSEQNKDVVCTFKNEKQKGSITIEKKTEGGNDKFNFDGYNLADFDIQTTNSYGKEVISDLELGKTYKVTEKPEAGWTLTDITCSQGGTKDGQSTAEIVLTSDKPDVTCTFTNKKNAKLTIKKEVIGPNGSFQFTGTGPSPFGPFWLAGGQQKYFTAFGNYEITEQNTPGYTLTKLECTGGYVDKYDATVKVKLDPGEEITCTYTNKRDVGSLKVRKATIGGNDDFSFTISGQPQPAPASFSLSNGGSKFYNDLPTGDYVINEVSLPEGWILKSASCGGGSFSDVEGGVKVTVGKDQALDCTFTNFKEKDDPMSDVTKLFVQRRVDNLLTYGPDRARMLRRLQERPQQPSLKDGTLKFGPSGGTGYGFGFGSGAAGAMSGAVPGTDGSAATSGDAEGYLNNFGGMPMGYNGTTSPDGVPWVEGISRGSENTDWGSGGSMTFDSNSPFAIIANQLTPLAAGQTSFKFGMSLSEMRAAAAAAEMRDQQKKLEAAGLRFEGQGYDPTMTMRQGLDIWVEGQISRYDDSTGGINREGDFRILYVGADYALAPGVLIGALVQIDDTREDVDNDDLKGDVEGTGWMVGPYFGARLDESLFFDARFAWGQSDNEISLWDPDAGHRSGSFDTTRWLASATLTGYRYYGAWRLSPQAGIAYGNESYDDFTNSLGQIVSGEDISIGRLTVGSEIGYSFHLTEGTVIEPHVGLSGIINFATDDLFINGTLVESSESRAKVEGGVIVRTMQGWSVRAAGAYDGIGGEDFESYSGSLWLNMELD